MKKGEVWRVRIPQAPGHGQTGERPAIIIQDDAFIASLPTVLIVPFTSTLAAARFDGTLTVQPDQQNGLTVPSVALVFQLRALDKRQCVRPLGELDASTLDQVLALLDQLTGR
jgi:mRNA interferase MazF